jgi:ketosteroid isomerase-like protein
MKGYSFLLVKIILFTALSCHYGKESNSADEEQIRQARKSSNHAIEVRDTNLIAQFWTNDYHLISSRNAEVSGLENNRHLFAKELFTKKDVLYIRNTKSISINPQWKMAGESGTWTGQWREPDGLLEINGNYFAKWHKVNGTWKIRAEIFVPLKCSGSKTCAVMPF